MGILEMLESPRILHTLRLWCLESERSESGRSELWTLRLGANRRLDSGRLERKNQNFILLSRVQ